MLLKIAFRPFDWPETNTDYHVVCSEIGESESVCVVNL